MEVKTVKDAFDRVAKKQKLSYDTTQEVVDTVSHEINKALNMIQDPPPTTKDHKSVVVDLKKAFEEISPSNKLEPTQKELNVALNKYQKSLEKTMNQDISKGYRNNIEFDSHTVHQIIASYFYRQGMFEIGDCFVSESGESESSSAKKPFMELYKIIEALKRRELEPALDWVALHSDKRNSDLEMKLYSLKFLEIAQEKNSKEAINYLKKHIVIFSNKDLQKLMCSLLWNGKLEKSPYTEFLSPALWTKAVDELTVRYCNFLGESRESPLSVTLAAGSQALPTYLKYSNVVREEWLTMGTPVELSQELQFHSVFVCPVTKDQTNEENPAMRLGCGHVLSKQSINKMSKNGTKPVKCPYCPLEADVSQCMQLYF